MYRITTPDSTTQPVNLELGTILDLLAPLAPKWPTGGCTFQVHDLSGQLMATVHEDGGVDATAQGASILRLVRARDTI